MAEKYWSNIVEDAEAYFDKLGARGVRSGAFYGVSNPDYYLPLSVEGDFLEAYRLCPILKAIVSKRAKAFNTGTLEALNSNSLKPARGQTDLMKLLKKPNVLQSGDQFQAQLNTYTDLFGYCPVLKVRSVGFENDLPSSIWNIPPWLFDIEYTGKWLNQANISGIYKKYFLIWNGVRTEINMEDLFFVFDDGIGTEYDTNLTIPDSRLISLEVPISNIIAAYKSRNTLITKRGAVGILSNEGQDAVGQTLPVEEEIKYSLQNDFKKYGLVGQPYQIIISDAKLKWQQMGFPTKDLMLFEEIEDDTYRLCDAFGWPAELVARGKDVTYENKHQARLDAYTSTTIPESNSRWQQITNGLFPGESNNILIRKNFDDVPVMQLERKKKFEALNTANSALKTMYYEGLITKNDWLEKLGMARITDPAYDEYYVAPIEPEENGKE